MKYLLLLSLIFTYSCVEEVSEKVQNSSTSEEESEVAKFENRSIRLVETMDDELSFIMHKYGDVSADCELDSPTLGFKADDYSKNDDSYAIDCILDVEELDLNVNGASIQLQVDDNLCEYIEYRPYSFVADLIGASQNTYYTVTCDETCANEGDAAIIALCGNVYDSWVDNGDTIFDGVNDIAAEELEDAEDACLFNYASKNCDLGYRQEVSITINGDNDLDDDGDADLDGDGNPIDPVCTLTDNVFAKTTQSLVSCGGDVGSCLGGPGAADWETEEDGSTEGISNGTRTVTIYENQDLETLELDFNYSSPSSLGAYENNLYLANYSRICANFNNDKLDGSDFSSDISDTDLNGAEIETLNLNTVDDDGNIESFWTVGPLDALTSDATAGWTGYIRDAQTGAVEGVQYAHHPFHALYGVQPYYQFKCLDKAKDTKAQIRLFIREWDKEFATTYSFINQSSDAASESTKYMDLQNEAQDGTEFWNDFKDWDDFFEDNAVFDNNNYQCSLSDHSDIHDEAGAAAGNDGLFTPADASITNANISGADADYHDRESFPTTYTVQ